MEKGKNIDNLLAELSDIVEKMEGEVTSVVKALELFERGVGVSEDCFEALNSYKGKLTVLNERLEKLSEANDD